MRMKLQEEKNSWIKSKLKPPPSKLFISLISQRERYVISQRERYIPRTTKTNKSKCKENTPGGPAHVGGGKRFSSDILGTQTMSHLI